MDSAASANFASATKLATSMRVSGLANLNSRTSPDVPVISGFIFSSIIPTTPSFLAKVTPLKLPFVISIPARAHPRGIQPWKHKFNSSSRLPNQVRYFSPRKAAQLLELATLDRCHNFFLVGPSVSPL